MRHVLALTAIVIGLVACTAGDGTTSAATTSTQTPVSGQDSDQLLDPESYIRANGYHSVKTGDDGITQFYSYTERATPDRITTLSEQIEALPKQEELLQVCDLMRGGAKARLIEERGIALDVSVTNYGYAGSIIACTLKYMAGSSVGTQHIFSKQGHDGMYMVFVTD